MLKGLNGIKIFGLFVVLFFSAINLKAISVEEPTQIQEEKFNPSEFILEHIGDSHEWHILTKKDGSSVAVYLPIIVYSKENGLQVFSSRRLADGQHYEGLMIAEEGTRAGRIVFVNENEVIDEENLPLDLSITKVVAGLFLSVTIGLILLLSLARSYKKIGICEPKGIQGFLEPIVLYVRDEIAIPNIGEHKYEKFMPYLLTVFFFILINNILGLIPFFPFGANITGNIAVTMVLALFSFFMINLNGNKNYWKHIVATPGVPLWLAPIMAPVEIIGMIAKPFALMVRLFANITAGHIIVLSLVSLIFIFKSVLISPVSILFVIFMDCLELLVAFLQAYVFTLLSALFISLAVQEEHH
jgi:F-type H+-transporting ATPase subunit a